jgi:hypothetical protein
LKELVSCDVATQEADPHPHMQKTSLGRLDGGLTQGGKCGQSHVVPV